jgi:hypothetical protein
VVQLNIEFSDFLCGLIKICSYNLQLKFFLQKYLTKVDKDLVFDVIIGLSVDDYDRRSFSIFYMGTGQELHWTLHMFRDTLFSLISIKTALHWFIS